MAQVLESYDFKRVGRQPQYPYDQWFDGQICKICKGIDFDCTVESMRVSLFTTAKKRGVRIRTAKKGDAIIIQRKD